MNTFFFFCFPLFSWQELDVTALLILSQERAEDFDWSEFLYIEEHSATYRRPVIESDIAGFYKPFSGQVMKHLSILYVFWNDAVFDICTNHMVKEHQYNWHCTINNNKVMNAKVNVHHVCAGVVAGGRSGGGGAPQPHSAQVGTASTASLGSPQVKHGKSPG